MTFHFRLPHYRLSLSLVTALFLVQACAFSELDPTEVRVPDWEVDLLGPIAKSDLGLNEIIQVDTLEFTHEVSLEDLGLDPGPAPVVPPFSIPATDFQSPELSDDFESITFDSTNLIIRITNQLPIPFNSGMVVLLENADGSLVATDTVENNLAANGDYEDVLLELTDVQVGNQLRISVSNISSPGSATPVVFEAGDGLRIDFGVNNFDVRQAIVVSNRSYNLVDTSAFNLSGDVIATEGVSGVFRIYATNGYPLNFEGWAILTDADYNVVDTLVGQTLLNGNSDRQLDTIEASQQQLDLYEQAEYVISRGSVNTNNSAPTVTLTDQMNVAFQVVGDLNVVLNSEEESVFKAGPQSGS